MEKVMLTITLKYDEVGTAIHDKANSLAFNAKEPTVIVMQFRGDTEQRVYSSLCASMGTPDEAREYYKHILNSHDRYYQYSDDHRVWSRGQAEADAIRSAERLMKERGIDVTDIYSEWSNK
jgi:glycerol-3-phosphate O-acyltransferase